MDFLDRTELLIGKESIEKLNKSTIAIFGIGGVGSFAAEALSRCGLGRLVLIDYDNIDVTNINRQIHSTSKTIGKAKVLAMKERLQDINPNLIIETYMLMYSENTAKILINKKYDYVIDAIDQIPSKVDLIYRCTNEKIPIVSAMGAGYKIDPTKFEITDIYNTSICPLAKKMRCELRKKGIKGLKVVYSKEKPIKNSAGFIENRNETPIASISFVPAVAGLILASFVVRELIGIDY